MRKYNLSENFRYNSASTSDGTQIKYYRDGYFYKKNLVGNEGLCEYLAYVVLKHSNIPKSLLVPYEYCIVNNTLGCRSRSFLGDGESFISIDSYYERVTGNVDLQTQLNLCRTSKDRLNYLLVLCKDIKNFKEYLFSLVLLDLLILNTDRHCHNYGFIVGKTGVRVAPIFDNGRSLNTDRLNNTVSRTLSGSFEEQVILFGFPVKSVLKLKYKSLLKELSEIEQIFGKEPELVLLKERLTRYKDLYLKR